MLLLRNGFLLVLAFNPTSLYSLYHLLLAWSIPASSIILITYIFDKIPYQHIWNPSVRELYPHRQWRIERATMRLLHSTHLIPKSQLLGPESVVPTEIWSLILDHAFDIPFFYDTTCEARHFNLFMSAQMYNMGNNAYDTIVMRRKPIRAVCRVWSR